MARRQVHIVQVAHVPGADDDAAGVGIVLDGFDGFTDLVDESAFIIGPRTPLVTVDMP
jgi:hypothetical protein